METTTQIYLEITLESGGNVLGETKAGGYENRIDIDSFSFSASAKKQSLKDVEDKKVRNNLDFSRVSISKVFDRSSLLMASALKRRARFSEAKIAVDQQFIDPGFEGKARNEILIFYLYGGYVADIKLRTSEGNVGAQIKEDIELSFHNFRVIYYAETRDDAGELVSDYRLPPVIYETARVEQEA